MFQIKKIYLNLGLILVIVLTSAATWFLTEFIVFQLHKIGDDYKRGSLGMVGEFRPEARAQTPGGTPLPKWTFLGHNFCSCWDEGFPCFGTPECPTAWSRPCLADPLPSCIADYIDGRMGDIDIVFPGSPAYNNDGERAYFTNVFDYIYEVYPDVLIIDYANPSNWAGNPFYQSEVPSELSYLHSDLNQRDLEHRYITSWMDLQTPLATAFNPWCYDKGNPEFNTFFADMFVRALNDTGIDGIYLDNWTLYSLPPPERPGYREVECLFNLVPPQTRESCPEVSPLNPRTNEPYTFDEYVDDCLAQTQATIDAVYNAHPTRRYVNGRAIVIPFNIGSVINPSEWSAAEILVDPDIPHTTGFWGEGEYFVTQNSHWNRLHPVATWLEHLEGISEAMDRDYIFINRITRWLEKEDTNACWESGDECGGDCYKDGEYCVPPLWPSDSRLMMLYASELLAGSDRGDKLATNYEYQHNWPGYNIDIGYAQADYYEWPGTNNIYARRLDRALVLVNPSDTAETINPGITYRRFQDYSVNSLDWRGLSAETSDPITVAGYSGEVLVTGDYPALATCASQGGSCCAVARNCTGARAYSSDCGKHCCVGGTCGGGLTCSSLSGTCCTSGQTCSGGSFQSSSDCGLLCCVNGTCATPPQTCAQLNGVDCCISPEICPGTNMGSASDCAGICCSAACQSSSSSAYTAIYVNTPPAIDGQISEFTSANPINIINSRGNTATYRLMWDNTALYISAQATDTQLNADHTQRDGNLWEDDCIELMIDTLHNAGASIQNDDYKFLVNILNTQKDSQAYNTGWNTTFSSQVTTTGTINTGGNTDTGYTLEIALPWTGWVTAPVENDTWGFDLAMDDKNDAGSLAQTLWANTNGGGSNDPDGWGDIVFTGTPGPSSCHQITPPYAIPDGYGAPWNTLSGSEEMLIQTTCHTDSVDIEAGNGDPLTYIYRMGYIYKNSAWQSYDLSGANPVTSDWYAQSVSANISMTPAELSGINYIVAYTCFWNGSEWKCGCRDSACGTNYWQLQIFGN